MLLYFTWDIQPYFTIAGFALRYYGICFAIAFFLGHDILKKMFKNDGISEKMAETTLVYIMFATLVGARLGHVIFYDWAYYKTHLLEIFLPIQFSPKFEFVGFRGLASHGAAITIIGMSFYLAKHKLKRSFLWLMDRGVIAICLGGSLIRLGNFFNSEIVGIPTSEGHPLGVVFTRLGENFPRHPAQLYESVTYLISFIVLYLIYWKTNKKESPGYIFGLGLLLIWTSRFLIEFVKKAQVDDRSHWILNTGQILSIPFIIGGLVLIFKHFKLKSSE